MKLYFDLLIATAIVMTALPAVILLCHRRYSAGSFEYKHAKLSLSISLFLLLGTLVLLYGSFVEPKLLIANEITIDLPNFSGPVRVAFIADPQVGPLKKENHIQKVADRIQELGPDLVLLGGDLVDNILPKEDETIYLKPLELLAKQVPTFAVHGNHEYGVSYNNAMGRAESLLPDVSEEVRERVQAMGIKYLANDLELLEFNGEKIYLFGGDSFLAGKLNFSVLNSREEKNAPTIALVHEPSAVFTAGQYSINLMLSGHTHGGQIRIPFFGAISRIDNTLPKKFYKGLHKIGGVWLFVTKGTGETGARARLFCPPEIAILNIK